MKHVLTFILILCVPLSALALSSVEIIRPQEAPRPGDLYTGLVFRSGPFTTLSQFDSQRFLYGAANFRPWNGSYWPTQKGMLAHRYNDPGFPNSKTWSVNRAYWEAAPGSSLVASGRIEALSPAEKYDLLVGDSNWTLTRAMWEKGTKPAERWGNVPGWFGICHGWSAANHMRTPEPQNMVNAVGAEGHTITFYPNDIKALASYLWAESGGASLFIGSKCRSPGPVRDEWGRVIDDSCRDTNPMTWHISVLNRVGRDGDSMVMDESMNNEIWNYAIDSYYFRYFNPNTMKPTRGWEDAVVPRDQYYGDPYKAHRAEGTAYIVGVVMEVFFPAATEPKAMGKLKKPLYKSKTFIYDLELDAAYNIIGGEWHSDAHPDFLWTYPFNQQAGATQAVDDVSQWAYGAAMPADLAARARQLSQRGKVVARIVNGLIERSVLDGTGLQHGEEERPVEEPGGNEDPGGEPTPGEGPAPTPGVSP